MKWKEIPDTKGTFQRANDPYYFTESQAVIRFNKKNSDMRFSDENDISVIGMVQVGRFIENGKSVSPAVVLSKKPQNSFKIDTANKNDWFLDVLPNTAYPFYQSSWLAKISPDKFLFPRSIASYNEQLVISSIQAEKENGFVPGEGLFIGGTKTVFNLLVDSPEIDTKYNVEFKTFAATLTSNGAIVIYEGISWLFEQSMTTREIKYKDFMKKEDSDIRDCVDNFKKIMMTKDPLWLYS